jgi:hypothetical protein
VVVVLVEVLVLVLVLVLVEVLVLVLVLVDVLVDVVVVVVVTGKNVEVVVDELVVVDVLVVVVAVVEVVVGTGRTIGSPGLNGVDLLIGKSVKLTLDPQAPKKNKKEKIRLTFKLAFEITDPPFTLNLNY